MQDKIGASAHPLENRHPFEGARTVRVREALGRSFLFTLAGTFIAAVVWTQGWSKFVPFPEIIFLSPLALVATIERFLLHRIDLTCDESGFSLRRGLKQAEVIPWSSITGFATGDCVFTVPIRLVLLDPENTPLLDITFRLPTHSGQFAAWYEMSRILESRVPKLNLDVHKPPEIRARETAIAAGFSADKNKVAVLLPYRDMMITAWIAGTMVVVFAVGIALFGGETWGWWALPMSLPFFWYALERNIQLEGSSGGLCLRRPHRVENFDWLSMHAVFLRLDELEFVYGDETSGAMVRLSLTPYSEADRLKLRMFLKAHLSKLAFA